MSITLRSPKYRPSLSADEIADCIAALEQTNTLSSALASLRLFQMKQSLGRVVPTNSTAAQQYNSKPVKDNPTDEELLEMQASILKEVASQTKPDGKPIWESDSNLVDIL